MITRLQLGTLVIAAGFMLGESVQAMVQQGGGAKSYSPPPPGGG